MSSIVLNLESASQPNLVLDNGITLHLNFNPITTDGIDGKSAYQIAVDRGFVGTEQEWLDSLGTGLIGVGVREIVFTQSIASNTWLITHDITYTPNVTVIDSTGALVEGSITYDSPTVLTISFTFPFSGTAYLR